MNNSIREALDYSASANVNDVLIYCDCEEEHVAHVQWIMHRLLEAGLYYNSQQFESQKEMVRYLGLVISTKGMCLNKDKLETV